MKSVEAWLPFSWHCSNCGTIVTGYKNPNGDIKVQCSRCRVVMIRKLRTKKHDTAALGSHNDTVLYMVIGLSLAGLILCCCPKRGIAYGK